VIGIVKDVPAGHRPYPSKSGSGVLIFGFHFVVGFGFVFVS